MGDYKFESAEETIKRLTMEKFGPGHVSERECIMTEDIPMPEVRYGATDVRAYVSGTVGQFKITDCYRDLNAITPIDKTRIRVALSRLCDEKVLERVGSHDGTYRRIERNVTRTKFITGRLEEFPIKLPIGLNNMCKLFPKNIVIVAGTKSAGKTAFMLNIALDNQEHMPVVYLNSEMGSEEYTSRLQAFGIDSEDQIKFDCVEAYNNFSDHIDGSKTLYIIDFMEIHDKFHEIGDMIRKVHEKLGDGMAIIAIQKKKGAEYGRGAEFSLEKARLYLTLEYRDEEKCTRVTIVDVKSPKVPGARGSYQDVKITGGAHFRALNGIKNHWETNE